MDANIRNRPVLVCGSTKPGDTSLDTAYRRVPAGLCDRLLPADAVVDVAGWWAGSAAALPVFRNDMRAVPAPDSWEYVAWTDYWEARHRRALAVLTFAMERHDDPALLGDAAAAFDAVIAEHPQPPAYYYKNLGIARARLAATDRASIGPAVDAFTTYLRLAPPDAADRAAIAQVVRELSTGR